MGDDLPTPQVPPECVGKTAKGDTVSWELLHHSVYYGREPIFEIEPCDIAICIMHMDLRIMKMMFDKCILSQLERFPNAFDDGDDSGSKVFELD